MDSIQIAYRDADRTLLLYLIREMGAAHEDLDVEIVRIADGEEYERRFLAGELDLICEHLRFLFPARLAGHPVRCLAACENHSVDRLVARTGIAAVEDLRGRTVAVRATESSRISAGYWLKYLGLAGQAQILPVDDAAVGRWQQWREIAGGRADAAVCSPLYLDAAVAAGLHDLNAPALPEIGPLFFAALGPFVERRQDALRRFMRSLYRALHVVHHDRKAALAVMASEPARLMALHDPAEIKRRFEHLREDLDERPVPRLDALATTVAMLNETYMPLDGLEPLAMWDLRFVLELEEQRFMEGLG
jgi:ABC-type nitrate/sulfonate/bicarbonate transport system substrate-binding protein